jgi:hypothetical protein
MGNASKPRVNIHFSLHNHGFEVYRQACLDPLLSRLQHEFPPDSPVDWNILETSPLVREQATGGVFHDYALKNLGPGCFPTHAILYNRNETAQPWHQDTQVKFPGPDFITPSDPTLYNRLLSVRLSLDHCTFADGALKLCPSSYKHGVLSEYEIRGHALRPFSAPEMNAGDILVMHPLTIHASAASQTGRPRRVLHIVFCNPVA